MMDLEYKLLAELYPRLEYLYLQYRKLSEKEHEGLIRKIGEKLLQIKEIVSLDFADELTEEKIIEIILFINSLRPLPKFTSLLKTLRNPQINKSITAMNVVLEEIRHLNRELAERFLFRHEQHYEHLVDLFHYKCLFLYFKNLVIIHHHALPLREELLDAHETLRETVLFRLEEICRHERWILGNHEFEKLFTKLGLNGELQSLQYVSLGTAKSERESLLGFVKRMPYQHIVECFIKLESQATVTSYMKSMMTEFRRLYRLLNECVLSLVQLYEHFDAEALQANKLLDARDDVLSMLESLHFSYDDIREGSPLMMERCETLGYADTKWPAKHLTIKSIHERGVKYRENYLRKNLVTIFRHGSDRSFERSNPQLRKGGM